ncbi:MAG: sugar phosphate isomerase/epimerase [Candidatus Latescibacteria bacterium]|jgi:sugar phosphate isomerase/epimerase|nr:sugar phosphate isomerase/epimerase [Candidatus Latescibacterota bacterium]
MRLGAPLFKPSDSPDNWIAALKYHGYTAAYCPLKEMNDSNLVQAYADAAKQNNIVIAEVGAFGNNPISPDDEIRKQGIENCQNKLALADAIGARCCVNTSGSRAKGWASPHPDNYAPDTFDLIVESVRNIIDGANPTRSYFALEMMPYMLPDSPESNLELLKAIDREQFAVHFDPVNIVNSPQRYYDNGALIRKCFEILGPYIKSCHAKDILLHDKLTTHLDEVRPGTGNLDYNIFLTELNKLDVDTSLMVEHLKGEDEYAKAAEHIRSVAKENAISL